MRLLLLIMILTWTALAFAQMEQQPTIPGEPPNQNGDLNTIKQNNTEDSFNKTYNGAGSSGMPVSSAIAPTLISNSPETCLQSSSSAVQGFTLAYSKGSYYLDPDCNRRRNASMLSQMGMKVAAVSLLCQDQDIFIAAMMASTPCPLTIRGKIVVGRRAYLIMKKNPSLYLADYEERRDFYDTILGVGAEDVDEEQSAGSMSDRFRSSKRDRDRQSDK